MRHLLNPAVISLTLVLPVCTIGVGQTVPHLNGDLERLWTVEHEPSWLEGPAYDDSGGVWFTDLKDLSPSTPTSILRFNIAAATVDVLVEDSGGANGLAFDQDGRLLAALWHDGSLTRRPVNDLADVTVLADSWQGMPLQSPNDIAVAGDGGIYFTEQEGQGVFYLNPVGELTLAATVSGSNGIALSPDGDTLYVTAADRRILSFNVSDDGVLADRQIFAEPGVFLDGLTTDRFGNLYVPHATNRSDFEVLVWNSDGDEVLVIEPPELVINATFAPDDILYLTGVTSLYRVPITFTTLAVCDFDSNNLCDVADIDLLFRSGDLSEGVPVPPGDVAFDISGDDIIDMHDADQWLADAATENGFAAPFARGDANLDGTIDAADLNALALNWRGSGAVWSGGDFSGDGNVTAEDLNVLALNWQSSVPLAAMLESVPEPFTGVLAWFGMLAALASQRASRR